MPEGPEVRHYADTLQTALAGKRLDVFSARTRLAKAWLIEHPDAFVGHRLQRIVSHGKNLVGIIEGDLYFYSHLLMWGRWMVVDESPAPLPDRRERARIGSGSTTAILLSAPIFEVGSGDPFQLVPTLSRLGPDILPYDGPEAFNASAFRQRLFTPEHEDRTIGAALLDQTIAAGIGNYLRAEVLFACRIDPWKRVGDLTASDTDCLVETAPKMADQIYRTGATVSDEFRARMRGDASLVYRLGHEVGARHAVFRRTNLPCLVCGTQIRQMRQFTHATEDGEQERIIYFCPHCQNTNQLLKPIKAKRHAE